MQNFLLYIIAIFFVIGAIDYIMGNKLKLGHLFSNGLKTMGPLAISMVGILSLTPLFSNLINTYLSPFMTKLSLDPSICSSCFIAVDMGAYNLSLKIAQSSSFIKFSGILVSSILGCTLSFTLPLSLGMIKEKDMNLLAKGMLCGLITCPIGLFIGGLLLKIEFSILLLNLMPIIILSVILSVFIIFKQDMCIAVFKIFGKLIVTINIIGLILQSINSIAGIQIIDNLMDLKEVLYIVGKIAIFLGGAYVMLECIQRVFKKQLAKLSTKFNIGVNSITALIGSLASAIVVFSDFDNLDDKGKILCSAFSVGGAYVLGGQLGFVASVDTSIISIYIITKLISGIAAIVLSSIIHKHNS